MDNQQVGKFIAGLRKSESMTQKELAEKLGVTDKAVSKWERGLGYPDISILPSLADIFEVTLEDILSGVQTSQMISDTSSIEDNTEAERIMKIESTSNSIEADTKAIRTMENEGMSNVVRTNSFFKKKHVKVIVFVQIVLSAIIGLTAVVSILYAGYMGDAIWETLKGLLTVWLMSAGIFGFLPLLSFYVWDSLEK